jgi:hypothetical protein
MYKTKKSSISIEGSWAGVFCKYFIAYFPIDCPSYESLSFRRQNWKTNEITPPAVSHTAAQAKPR